jgi:hypothetical protein
MPAAGSSTLARDALVVSKAKDKVTLPKGWSVEKVRVSRSPRQARAEIVIVAMSGRIVKHGPAPKALAEAPFAPEPYTPEERAKSARARADVRAGKGLSTAELRRRLGL